MSDLSWSSSTSFSAARVYVLLLATASLSFPDEGWELLCPARWQNSGLSDCSAGAGALPTLGWALAHLAPGTGVSLFLFLSSAGQALVALDLVFLLLIQVHWDDRVYPRGSLGA